MEPTAIPPDAFNILKTLWSHTIISRYSLISGAMFYVWEYFLTLPDEVEYFWNSKWSLIKFLFFLNRYHRIPIMVLNTFFEVDTGPDRDITNADGHSCIVAAEFGIVSGIFGALVIGVAAPVILQIRLHALYGQNRLLVFALSTLFVLQSATIITMGALDTRFDFAQYKHLAALCPLRPSAMIPQSQITFMPFGFPKSYLILFWWSLPPPGLSYAIRRSQGIRSRGTLLSIFLRDSILVFLVNFLIYLTNLLMWQRGPRDLFSIVAFWALVIPSVVVNRMLLNLRKAGREKEGMISSSNPDQGVHTVSTFRAHRSQRGVGDYD
ncbi:hypothetical protein BD779DRAFT_1674251 [Infundibulicybe gibba]|nr:hypothetical protein BD779DRAFT_1674251 [Infundibulicybe gibba]